MRIKKRERIKVYMKIKRKKIKLKKKIRQNNRQQRQYLLKAVKYNRI